MHRQTYATYKAVERNSNREVVMKVKRKIVKGDLFHNTLQVLEKLNSPYLVRYLMCYEDEEVCKVKEQAVHNAIDRNGEL